MVNKMTMKRMKMKKNKDKKEILIFKTLRVNLLKRPSRKCRNKMRRIKLISSKRMTMEEEFDLETEEGKSRQREE